MVRKVVSLYEDTKETFLSDGIEIGERKAHNSLIGHLLDLAISKADEKGITLEQYLTASDYDEYIREEILKAYHDTAE